MNPQFSRVVIIGVGLLGGSLGLALKARGLAGRVLGVGHRAASLETALRVGAVDEVSQDPRNAVAGADLIVLATPAALVTDMMDEIRDACPADAVVTDVASTKSDICAHAQATWAAPRRFIGSHPMAGSEKFGPEHAYPALYEQSVCLVERNPALDPGARARVVALWTALGAQVVDIEPALHDALLARTSHIPHIVASALATLAVRKGDVRLLIGNGFRDMTRIAASRPEIWRDIALTNRNAIIEGLTELERYLGSFHEALTSGDAAALDAFFAQGRAARHEAVGE